MAAPIPSLSFSFTALQLLSYILILKNVSTCVAQKVGIILSQPIAVAIDARTPIAQVDDNFLCATLDWWPPEKCDYGTCSWGRASILNLDLSNQLLHNAVQGLRPMLRLGGSLQDTMIYGVGNLQSNCVSQIKSGTGLFGFSQGCLNMSRWDALNQFFQETGVQVAFGLNALYGRETDPTRPWDPTNARDFIKYTMNRKYPVQAWEFGNELSGSGVGASVPAKVYALDLKALRASIDQIYSGSTNKPLIVAPDGFLDGNWYTQLLQGIGNQVINACSRHIYNLGAGVDTDLVGKILNPGFLSQEAEEYRSMQQLLKTYAPGTRAWIGEAGGAYNSGQHLVTDAFVFGFWYADQLGMSATFNNSVHCRQSLVGGNYGLLDHTTFKPNPDYYSALLWKTLMGNRVLSASVNGSIYLRAYAHCSKNDPQSISVLLINLSNTTRFKVDLVFNPTSVPSIVPHQSRLLAFDQRTSRMRKISGAQSSTRRSEYHLTSPNGDLQSQDVLLNGALLQLTSTGNLPTLNPIWVNPSRPIKVAPTSIVFVKVPNSPSAACP